MPFAFQTIAFKLNNRSNGSKEYVKSVYIVTHTDCLSSQLINIKLIRNLTKLT